MALDFSEYRDGDTDCLEVTLPAENWKTLTAEFAQAFEFFFERVKNDLSAKSWNRITMEIWDNSGRIIMYPHKRGKMKSDRALSIDIEVPLFLREYDALPSPEDDEDLFESHYGALCGRLGLAISSALERKSVTKLLRALAAETDFQIWQQDADDPEEGGALPLVY